MQMHTCLRCLLLLGLCLSSCHGWKRTWRQPRRNWYALQTCSALTAAKPKMVGTSLEVAMFTLHPVGKGRTWHDRTPASAKLQRPRMRRLALHCRATQWQALHSCRHATQQQTTLALSIQSNLRQTLRLGPVACSKRCHERHSPQLCCGSGARCLSDTHQHMRECNHQQGTRLAFLALSMRYRH